MLTDRDTTSMLGARAVFNGAQAAEMFSPETVPLPDLSPGEILVKVSQSSTFARRQHSRLRQVRLASICMSDVHTITGQRVEPTPR